MAKLRLKSVEDASVIRKFSVLFALMSFFPFIILSVLFFILYFTNRVDLDSDLFFWSVFLSGVFAIVGFFGIRQTLTSLNKISEGMTGALRKNSFKGLDIKNKGDNEIVQIARSFNEVVRKLEANINELEKSKNLLQDVLGTIASGVSFTESINSFLDLIVKTTVSALSAKTGLLLIIDNFELVVKSSYGLERSDYPREKRLPFETGVLDWVIKEKKPLLVPRLEKFTEPETQESPAFQPPLVCAPLIFQNRIIGVIIISGKQEERGSFLEEELIIVSNISSQVALAIENAKLNSDAKRVYMETIAALAMAVEARDIYSRGHSDRVRDYALRVAKRLNLTAEKTKDIKEAAQLHDVGKIGISDGILLKPQKLNDYEKQLMQQHPVIGEGIIMPLHDFYSLRDPIRHHHEWLNGQGYPDHLKAGQISIEAKILAVADSFDAMTTDRPYRKAMSQEEAKKELLKYKDIRYDAKVVDAFIDSA